jgi:hypothetical protein
MAPDSYIPQTSRLLRGFDRSFAHVKRMLAARFGEQQANTLIRESRREYETLIPRIPYIGGQNPLLVFLLPTSRYLAIYRVLRRQGLALDDAGQLIIKMNEAELKAIPAVVRRVIGYLWFSPWFRGRIKKRAAESRSRRYPGGYVLTYVPGDGRDFDYGIDYTECAGCTFLRGQDASELLPYVCAMDQAASELLGWGLRRTTTLGEGREKCDFRFTQGGTTDVALPRSLTQIDQPRTA